MNKDDPPITPFEDDDARTRRFEPIEDDEASVEEDEQAPERTQMLPTDGLSVEPTEIEGTMRLQPEEAEESSEPEDEAGREATARFEPEPEEEQRDKDGEQQATDEESVPQASEPAPQDLRDETVVGQVAPDDDALKAQFEGVETKDRTFTIFQQARAAGAEAPPPPVEEEPEPTPPPPPPVEEEPEPTPPPPPPIEEEPEPTSSIKPTPLDRPTKPHIGVVPEEELEQPYSLQPDEVASADTEAEAMAGTVTQRSVRKKLWLTLGAIAGLAVCAWYYFQPHPAIFPAFEPAFERLEALPSIGDPPTPPPGEQDPRWTLLDGMFLGRDATERPWIYRPDSGDGVSKRLVGRASSDAPAETLVGSVGLVARPPMEPYTRLAWIEQVIAAPPAYQMILRDYRFEAAGGETSPHVNRTIPLEGDAIRFAPTIVDHPDPAVGFLQVVIDADRRLRAYRPNPEEVAEFEIAWEKQLEAPATRAPVAWLDWEAEPPAMWLIAPTAGGVEVLDVAAGRKTGSIEWKDSMQSNPPAAMAPIRLGSDGWGWAVSDGRICGAFRIDKAGQPILVWSVSFEEPVSTTSGGTLHLLTFPDGARPENDQVVVMSDEGSTAWFESPATEETIPVQSLWQGGSIVGDPVATDLNGDGFWDLVGMRSDGKLLVADGRVRADRTDRLIQPSELTAPASDVLWNLTSGGLVGDTFDRDGRPRRVRLELSATAMAKIERLKTDWNRRRCEM